MAIEIVGFPIENGGSFHSYVAVYQRVWGIPHYYGVYCRVFPKDSRFMDSELGSVLSSDMSSENFPQFLATSRLEHPNFIGYGY